MQLMKVLMEDLNQSINSPSMSSTEKLNSKRKRNSNFSKEEINCLLLEYGQRASTLNFGTREQKQKIWEEITNEINNTHPDFLRNVTEVKKKWIDLLYATKKEYVKATKEAERSGTGQRRKLSEIAEMIVKVRGGFSKDKRGKNKNVKRTHVVNFEIPSSDGENVNGQTTTTTFYVPTVEDCRSSGDESNNDGDDSPSKTQNTTLMLTTQSLNDSNGDHDTYCETYGEVLPITTTLGTACACGLAPDLIRLKQEAIGIMKRKIQIEEERRIEEKQKWWEEKALLRLKRQKLELEIKQLQANQK